MRSANERVPARLDTREFSGDGAPLAIYNAVQPFTDAKP